MNKNLNKFKGNWLSASSIANFKSCPLSYYYANVFKDTDKKKISTVSKYMTLGLACHEPLEALSDVPSEQRKDVKLSHLFYDTWDSLSGEKGGFDTSEQEAEFKARGVEMLKNVKANIHHLEGQTVTMLPDRRELPWFWLDNKNEEEGSNNLVLCGKVDFCILNGNTLRVLDFKTGLKEEKDDSLQLPIYRLLADHFYPNKDFEAFYWYIGKDAAPKKKEIPSVDECRARVMEIGLKIKEAREKQEFECPNGEMGCRSCLPYKAIVNGRAKFVGLGTYGAKMFKIFD